MKAFRFSICSLIAGAALSPLSVKACATCFGQSDEAMAKGMNMGILVLLICIVGVLLAMVGVGIFFARRASRMSALPGANNPAAFAVPVGQNLK